MINPGYDFYMECPTCKGVAFEYAEIPVYSPLKSELAYLPKQNSRPRTAIPMLCDNCGVELKVQSIGLKLKQPFLKGAL